MGLGDMSATKYKPVVDSGAPAGMGGAQKIYRFPNGYGASVLTGGVEGMFYTRDGTSELAVIRFTGDGHKDFELTYDTPVADDVLGYLSDEEVAETLDKIAALPAASGEEATLLATVRVSTTVRYTA
jgi:hypothetical protein